METLLVDFAAVESFFLRHPDPRHVLVADVSTDVYHETVFVFKVRIAFEARPRVRVSTHIYDERKMTAAVVIEK